VSSRRSIVLAPWVTLWLTLSCVACGDDGEASDAEGPAAESSARPSQSEQERVEAERARAEAEARRREQERMDREFPHHGAVTGIELRVYAKPDPEATVVGWLRVGSQVRLAAETTRGRECRGGYRAIYPTGYVCPADGLEVREGPIEIETPTDEGWKEGQPEEAAARGALVLPPPARQQPLPYDYYFVKELAVPSYHRLPSRNEQRAALAKSQRYVELLEKDEERARRYLSGEIEAGPKGTEVTARYLDRGFFVASNGSEVRAFRRFVRTNQGRYIKQAQLEPRPGAEFHGVELGAAQELPLAFSVRDAQPLIATQGEDGSYTFREDPELDPIERQTLLTGWQGTRRMGGRIMHELSTERGPRYLRSWFAVVAYPIERPRQAPAGRPFVHVDLSQQTAVLYEHDRPVFATLVSTGIEDHETPTGVFQIRHKRVTDTMADLGPEAGDNRYRVEDVPWTQYFEGSFALHAAFWHTRFGIRRSHGCINMSPRDAHRVFRSTWPKVPEGWHGLSTDGTDFEGSFVVITDEDPGVIRVRPEADEVAEGEGAEPTEAEPAAEVQEPTEPEPDARGISATARSVEPWQKRQPTEVKYTVKRGGTARFVANLYQIFHSEMEALNPDVDLDRELEPGTELVVYHYDPKEESRSIGKPDRGSIEHAVPLPDGEGRILKATPRRMWATRRTVGLLDAVLRAWPQLEPHAQPLLVGNMSLRKGGPLKPHRTHQSGRDVDLGYPQLPDEDEPYNWRDMDARNLDVRRTWRLLHLLDATGELEVVFMDRSLQKLLYEYAVENNLLSAEDLAAWLEFPRLVGDGSPKVQHVPGHVDHLHVRFSCGGQPGCE
jgi:hypothetical protein